MGDGLSARAGPALAPRVNRPGLAIPNPGPRSSDSVCPGIVSLCPSAYLLSPFSFLPAPSSKLPAPQLPASVTGKPCGKHPARLLRNVRR